MPNLVKAGITFPKTVFFTAQVSAIVTSYDTRLQQWIGESLIFPSLNHRYDCGIVPGPA